MRFETRVAWLRIALAAFGVILIVAVGPLMLWLWPSGWAWGAGHSHYPPMIVALYVVLGVFLLLAARRPRAYAPIVWFAVWSSVAHGTVMAVQAWWDPAELGHFIGDIPALFVMAIVLGLLMPREAEFVRAAAGP
jgi:hypothetical protein